MSSIVYNSDIRLLEQLLIRSYSYVPSWHNMVKCMDRDTQWLFQRWGVQGIVKRWYCIDLATDSGYDRWYYFRSREDLVLFQLACSE